MMCKCSIKVVIMPFTALIEDICMRRFRFNLKYLGIIIFIFCLITSCSQRDNGGIYNGKIVLSDIEESDIELKVEDGLSDDAWSIEWRSKRDYPLKLGDEDWNEYSFPEKMEILNPPDDLLESFSMDELVELFLTYPLLPYMPSVDEDRTGFMIIYQGYSSIAKKFIESDYRFNYLMKAFADNELDLERFADSDGGFFYIDYWSDVVTQRYVLAYGENFTEEEKRLYKDVFSEREEKYYSKLDRSGRVYLYQISFSLSEPFLMIPQN